MSLMDEFKKIIHPYDDEDDDYEEDVGRDSEPTYFEPREPREPRESSRRKEVPAEERRNKVVNIHATTQLKVVLVKPERFENASEIADHLREKRTVVLNLEGTNKDVARRLVDFLSGVAYAGDGKIKKVSTNTYIITPYSVDLMGDLCWRRRWRSIGPPRTPCAPPCCRPSGWQPRWSPTHRPSGTRCSRTLRRRPTGRWPSWSSRWRRPSTS